MWDHSVLKHHVDTLCLDMAVEIRKALAEVAGPEVRGAV
jgi:hypothetical protein